MVAVNVHLLLRTLAFCLWACVSGASLADSVEPLVSDTAVAQPEPQSSEALSSQTRQSEASASLKPVSGPGEIAGFGNKVTNTTTSWPIVILTLVGVIGFIFALAWMAKRFGGLSAMGMRDLKVVAAMPVGTREKVAIIDVKGQQFLIGITAQNINHLHTFAEPAISEQEKRSGEFAQKLASIMTQKNNSVANDDG